MNELKAEPQGLLPVGTQEMVAVSQAPVISPHPQHHRAGVSKLRGEVWGPRVFRGRRDAQGLALG